MGGSGVRKTYWVFPNSPPKHQGQCGKKNLLHCAPSLSPKAELWALEAHVHKTTCGPLIETGLYVMPFVRANPLLGQVRGDWALESLTFFNGTRLCIEL